MERFVLSFISLVGQVRQWLDVGPHGKFCMPSLSSVNGHVLAHCVGSLLAHVAIGAHEVIKIIVSELCVATNHCAEFLQWDEIKAKPTLAIAYD
jgi:hypothetical protein